MGPVSRSCSSGPVMRIPGNQCSIAAAPGAGLGQQEVGAQTQLNGVMEYPMTRASGLAVLAVLTLVAGQVAAQEKTPRLGLAAAERLCAECHAVRGGELRSPFSSAPAFPTIAAVPGMTAMARPGGLKAAGQRNSPLGPLRRAGSSHSAA